MFNKILFLLVVILVSTEGNSSENTNNSWMQLLEANKLPVADQSYCYSSGKGQTEGVNQDIQIRLASVSKLLTSLMAIEKLGINYKYKTKLYIKDNNLHIAGSLDPFLGNEKMFFLISQLNDLGYNTFDNITFDKFIQINPNAEISTDEYPLITRATNARNLKIYFNTKNWSQDLNAEYFQVVKSAPEGNFRKNVEFAIGNAKYADVNPFENDSDVKILTLSSPELYKYLKEINVQSNNYAAHTIFLHLGGALKFEKYLNERYNYTSDSIHLYNGSGLPDIINGVRRDNYATCTIIIELVEALKNLVEKNDKELKDILAVPGSDAGTFRNRTFPANYKNSFLAKSGTLVHTSTIAGAMSSQHGYSFYGIFNQSRYIEGSKIVQNEMIKTIMTEMGGPVVFDYDVDPFHTYDFENPEFTTIEEDLY